MGQIFLVQNKQDERVARDKIAREMTEVYTRKCVLGKGTKCYTNFRNSDLTQNLIWKNTLRYVVISVPTFYTFKVMSNVERY